VLKVFGWSERDASLGSHYYRMQGPLVEAQHQGLLTWTQNVTINQDAERSEVIICPGLADPGAVHRWELIASAGYRLLVAEHDDDLINPRPDNPFFRLGRVDYETYRREYVPLVGRAMDVSDLVIVSVPYLREVYAEHTTTPIVVVPNTVDDVLLEVPQAARDAGERLRVGWGGSSSHDLDWQTCADGVRAGIVETGAQLELMGHDYRRLIGVPDATHVPWTTAIEQYYLWMSRQHVIVAPLADDQFNRSKSPLKALEAAALGIPVVASDAGPYRDFVRHGETGFLCRTDDDWVDALRALATDEDRRLAMGRAGRAQASELTTQKWAPVWAGHFRDGLVAKFGDAVRALWE